MYGIWSRVHRAGGGTKLFIPELSNFAAAIGGGGKFLSEQIAGFPFSIKKGDTLLKGVPPYFYLTLK